MPKRNRDWPRTAVEKHIAIEGLLVDLQHSTLISCAERRKVPTVQNHHTAAFVDALPRLAF